MRKWKLRGRKYLAKCTQPVSSTVWGTPSLLRYSTLPSGGDCPQVLSHPMTDPQTTRPSPSSARWSEYKPTIATYRKVSLVHQHLRSTSLSPVNTRLLFRQPKLYLCYLPPVKFYIPLFATSFVLFSHSSSSILCTLFLLN